MYFHKLLTQFSWQQVTHIFWLFALLKLSLTHCGLDARHRVMLVVILGGKSPGNITISINKRQEKAFDKFRVSPGICGVWQQLSMLFTTFHFFHWGLKYEPLTAVDTLQHVNSIESVGTALKNGLKKKCILLNLITSNAILKTRVFTQDDL